MTKEFQMTNDEFNCGALAGHSSFGLRHSLVIMVSTFGIFQNPRGAK
jgi:hypothetical protein